MRTSSVPPQVPDVDPLALVEDDRDATKVDLRMAKREQGAFAHEAQRQGVVGRLFGSIDNAPVNSMAITLVFLALATVVLAILRADGVEVTASVMAAIIGYFAGKHGR